jgi:trans-2,3-dihydro-3-hydroxyanthranilate isomerase
MASAKRFYILDVFTSRKFGGNQLAVIIDGRGLSTAAMQSIAREFNFSETTFVLPARDSSCARRVRIFTPQRELPVAGHPTVGTSWILASRGEFGLDGKATSVKLELGVGPIAVTIEGKHGKPDFVWMTHRPAQFGAIRKDRARVAAALGLRADDLRTDLPVQTVSTGVPLLFLPFKSLDALKRSVSEAKALGSIFAASGKRQAIYLFTIERTRLLVVRARMYAPHDGIVEDPATGGAAGPLGAYAAKYGLIDAAGGSFTIRQGVEMGRPSEIRVEVTRGDAGAHTVRIGGRCAIVAEGTLLP